MQTKKHKKAFSLIELSIVILIISILAAGAISVSTVALTNAKTKVTHERLNAIYKAIGSFVARNYRLPCPASLMLTRSDPGYGSESGSGDCRNPTEGYYLSNQNPQIIYGMVPVAALGLSDEMAEDGFGSKIGYVINSNLTIAEYPNEANNGNFSFYNPPSEEMIKIYQLPSTNIVENVAFTLISHGANKYGGFNSFSSSQNSIANADLYERSNALENVAPGIHHSEFGMNPDGLPGVALTSLNSNSDVFDDILLFKTKNQLITDFDLGFLMPCTDQTVNWEDGYNNAYAGETKRSEMICPDGFTIPTKKCGPLASTWINQTICPF